MQKLLMAWPLALFLLLPVSSPAETAVQAWVQRYHGPANGDNWAYAAAVDSSNNVIVTGYSAGSGIGEDYATIQYSSAGVPLWTNRYNGPAGGANRAKAVAVDSSNNVIVTGYSDGGGSSYDYATIKYSSAGVPLWTNRYNGPGNSVDYARAVAVDASNNVIITGSSTGSTGGSDYATIKYSSVGLPLWTNRYNGPGNSTDNAEAVAVDGNNDVLVTGISCSSADLSSSDFATIKYSSAGMPLWTNRFNGPGDSYEHAFAVAVDSSNNVIVTGYSEGSDGFDDYATIKYSSAGLPLWTNYYSGPDNRDDEASAVAVDGSNNIIVTGMSWGSGNSADYATVKYSGEGLPLWTNRYHGSGNGIDSAAAVAVDQANNVIVTGGSVGNGSYADYATIKYSSAGVPLWTNRYNGPANGLDTASAVVVDHLGSVIVTGYSTGAGSAQDFATVKYEIVSPSPPILTGLALTNGSFQMEVDGVWQPGTLVIESSADLTVWSPVFTNTATTNVIIYTDPDAGDNLGRFYRAYQRQ